MCSSGPPPAPAAVGPPARRREPSADATLSALGSTPFITAVPLEERLAGGEDEEEEGEAGQPGPEPYNVGCARGGASGGFARPLRFPQTAWEV